MDSTISSVSRLTLDNLLLSIKRDNLPSPVVNICCDTEDDKEVKEEDYWINVTWPILWLSIHIYHDGSVAIMTKNSMDNFTCTNSNDAIRHVCALLNIKSGYLCNPKT